MDVCAPRAAVAGSQSPGNRRARELSMIRHVSQRSILMGRVWVALLAIAIGGSWGCGVKFLCRRAWNHSNSQPTPYPAQRQLPPLPAGTIGLKVLDTSVPPGGIFQFQLSNTEPKPIGHGSTRPQVPAGPVRGVAINDPSGKAAGIAVINTSVSPTDIKLNLAHLTRCLARTSPIQS